MKIEAFRITHFRSIVDTGWCNFSPDGVTVLVGQNESGKTTVLEALSKTFSSDDITPDDLRTNEDLPQVFLKVVCEDSEIDQALEDYPEAQISIAKEYLSKRQNRLELEFGWHLEEGKYSGYVDLDFPELEDALEIIKTKIQEEKKAAAAASKEAEEAAAASNATEASGQAEPNTPPPQNPQPTPQNDDDTTDYLTVGDIASEIYRVAPRCNLFEQKSGLLPDTVDINNKFELIGDGSGAAQNFMAVAGINVAKLVESDRRARAGLLEKANQQISRDFNIFWTQKIGRGSQIQLECEYHNYPAGDPKAGKAHLVFWISDGMNKLYPKQRSQGVRWFISFYLQLRATEKSSNKRIFFLDEPGANLHSKAQEDVLRLINLLSKDIMIVYSTHSPHMIEYGKLPRILAVQRTGDLDDSPTSIIGAQQLGSASTDTLSPILTAMGVDLSHQQVIRKENNVLLEEMSAHYYLSALWLLTKEKQEAHFLAATGVGKVELLANLFRGWGLKFIAAVDDDSHGREVYKSMKKELFGDIQELAETNILKFENCPGIEDMFSAKDFKEFVLNDPSANIDKSNSEYVKAMRLSKPILGFQFLAAVQSKPLKLENFDEETRKNMKTIVKQIVTRLKAQSG